MIALTVKIVLAIYIPTTIGELIEKGEARVKMYASHDAWQGVTYKEDKPGVMAALRELKEKGMYPERLWR